MGRVILTVDDEPSTLKLFRDVLESRGYRVIEAADGRQAVEIATTEMPDLIIMDIGMPDMDGLQAATVIKSSEATCRIPIMALTGFATQGYEEAAYAAGCDGYISKPVDIGTLLASVEQELEKRHPVRPSPEAD